MLWRDERCRVILVGDQDYPAFCRVIWYAHEIEMSDLAHHERLHVMNVVFAVEAALRKLYQPVKINLASFGNMVPHLHWHVVPRFADDRHFPEPIWGRAQRQASAQYPVDPAQLAQAIAACLGEQELPGAMPA